MHNYRLAYYGARIFKYCAVGIGNCEKTVEGDLKKDSLVDVLNCIL